MTRAVFLIVLSFALGMLVRDAAQDWKDKAEREKLLAQVRACPQYIVVRADGSMDCRALMPRLDFVFPLPPRTTRNILAQRSTK